MNDSKMPIKEESMEVFRSLYINMLVARRRIEVVDVRRDGTYVLRVYSPIMKFDRETRSFKTESGGIFYYLSPWGAMTKNVFE